MGLMTMPEDECIKMFSVSRDELVLIRSKLYHLSASDENTLTSSDIDKLILILNSKIFSC
jgi:hypothetical protein